MKAVSRPMASPIEGAVLRPRHILGVDRRLLVVPIFVPCAISIVVLSMRGHGGWAVVMCGVTFVLWVAAKALWEWNPYFIDDFQVEASLPSRYDA